MKKRLRKKMRRRLKYVYTNERNKSKNHTFLQLIMKFMKS